MRLHLVALAAVLISSSSARQGYLTAQQLGDMLTELQAECQTLVNMIGNFANTGNYPASQLMVGSFFTKPFIYSEYLSSP